MNLSNDCKEKLNQWVQTDTWHSNHVLDLHRFFQFVDQYQKDHGYHVNDEAILAETIASIANVTVGSHSPLFDTIRERVSLMVDILDFLRVTNR